MVSIISANVFVLKHCTFLVGCPVSWTAEENTNYLNGVVNSADSVEDCQSACISNASCNGVDWDGNQGVSVGRRCWLSGPWSGAKREAQGVTHYILNRNCAGKNVWLARSLPVSLCKKNILFNRELVNPKLRDLVLSRLKYRPNIFILTVACFKGSLQ